MCSAVMVDVADEFSVRVIKTLPGLMGFVLIIDPLLCVIPRLRFEILAKHAIG